MDAKKPKYTKEVIEFPDMRFALRRGAVFTFTLPNGKTGRWEALHRSPKPTVLMAGLTEEANLILVRQFRFGVEAYTYELPGGNVDPNEDTRAAAKREFLEETGYHADSSFEKITEGWLYNSAVNTPFVIYYALNCHKIKAPALGEVERHTQVEVVEQSIWKVAEEIGRGNKAYDPTIAHALVALVAQRKMSPFALVPEHHSADEAR